PTIFYPDFYPNRAHRRLEVPYLLITAANWIGRPESVTSLPSWSCGFDSRRPLSCFLAGQRKVSSVRDLLRRAAHRAPPEGSTEECQPPSAQLATWADR